MAGAPLKQSYVNGSLMLLTQRSLLSLYFFFLQKKETEYCSMKHPVPRPRFFFFVGAGKTCVGKEVSLIPSLSCGHKERLGTRLGKKWAVIGKRKANNVLFFS